MDSIAILAGKKRIKIKFLFDLIYLIINNTIYL